MGMTSPPLASPGINGPPHNVMGSPRVRGSPKMGASPFSPGGMKQTFLRNYSELVLWKIPTLTLCDTLVR